jgi:hypothetical protein
VWLHTDCDCDGVLWQELRSGFERLRRDLLVRQLHFASNLRGRGNRQRLRLHEDGDGQRMLWEELRQRRRWLRR